MSKEQDQPLNNPFKNLDKSQYRDARQERRPAPVKIKKTGKMKNVLEDGAEEDIFTGLMRDSGVAPLEKGKRKAAPASKNTAPSLFSNQETAPEPVQPPEETPHRFSSPPPSGQAGASGSSPGAGEPRARDAQPVFRASEGDDFINSPSTLADLGAFAALKSQAKALPRHQEKPAPAPIRVSKGAAPLCGEVREERRPSRPPEATLVSPPPPAQPRPHSSCIRHTRFLNLTGVRVCSYELEYDRPNQGRQG